MIIIYLYIIMFCLACVDAHENFQKECSHIECCEICYLDSDDSKRNCSHIPFESRKQIEHWNVNEGKSKIKSKSKCKVTVREHHVKSKAIGPTTHPHKCPDCPYGTIGEGGKCRVC